jgi:alkyl hydroperoxide reductase subunit AhpC/tRNA A-37 threonylcarbamoyl transferase component Bud32
MPLTKVGEPVPRFDLMAVKGARSVPERVQLDGYRGRWLTLVFYPRDFSFVCPTELKALSERHGDFESRQCELLGVSVDSTELHQEWLAKPIREGGLGPLHFPLASDPNGEAARAYGVWVEEKQVATRGLFIIDPDGILQYVVVQSLNVGRQPEEVIRVLDALQNGGLCPAAWTTADGTIDLEQALDPGKILGHYRIRQSLGNGAYGTVFSAWDMQLERHVALKILRRTVVDSRDSILTEARAAARLNHPNICVVYAVEEEAGLPVLVMEYVEGEALSEQIATSRDRAFRLRLLRQLASGLAAAHEHDVVHGDFKPANVMVAQDGTAKILDFGLARTSTEGAAETPPLEMEPAILSSHENVDSAEIAKASMGATVACGSGSSPSRGEIFSNGRKIRGTLAYLSPEQAEGQSATKASDVFAFGLTMFEVLTSQRAISANTPLEALTQVRKGGLASELSARLESGVGGVLESLLARDSSGRPTMQEVFRELCDVRLA